MKLKNILWGLFFLGSGGLFILNEIGYLEYASPAKLIITLLMVIAIIYNTFKLNFGGVFVPLAIIVVVFKDVLEIDNISNMSIIAASVFISIGFHLIFSSSRKFGSCISINSCNSKEFIKDVTDNEVVIINATFSEAIKYINTDNFKKAKITSSFAGVKVYFDNAKIKSDSAEININSSFSGVELFIPKEWNVVNNANVSLAGIDEKNKAVATGPTVVITGNISLAGVEIIYI